MLAWRCLLSTASTGYGQEALGGHCRIKTIQVMLGQIGGLVGSYYGFSGSPDKTSESLTTLLAQLGVLPQPVVTGRDFNMVPEEVDALLPEGSKLQVVASGTPTCTTGRELDYSIMNDAAQALLVQVEVVGTSLATHTVVSYITV
jgi:hypothetical protein